MYQHFTEYHIYEALVENKDYAVAVNKEGVDRCMFVTSGWSLPKVLTHLDNTKTSGWVRDQDVGAHIATYSITTHPELFI